MAAARSARAKAWAPGELPPPASGPAALWQAWRQRWRRQKLLARAIRKRRELRLICDRSAAIGTETVLCAMVLRNEATRLPWFLEYHRRLGVGHFLIIDNGSSDGSRALLEAAPDVTLWATTASYKQSRFGLDWLNWVLLRHGHGHWCLVLDADELLVYPHSETRPLAALTEWLDLHHLPAMPAMMLDLYPDGPISAVSYQPGDDPLQSLAWFDSGNYSTQIQPALRNLWIQGGVRARQFFAQEPRRAPTLNKIPLIRWHWRYALLNSTHSLLPPKLNQVYDETGGESLSGVLLHTKFLPEIIEKSAEEKERAQHFGAPQQFGGYYDAVIADPVLKSPQSRRYQGWRQLEALGLLSRGGWL
ncbi:glycosyltransferase family 2 protein [Pseudogemmobacter faecipullorum]|uniref:Glycosyltransferase family 2 protein n=1 Tax=Pseudogemmobacter faecipullorum TaxID=2755041 RepID=A0ABS8CHL3_9RHOB|nr:glycosyltransferase family 2 protein [Pseudogemmobacter faecipullorum]MCB5408859.1 glycosyltransferase family 2 protein [Pseudogemmobacter faecipullorum]